ncbi:hypothetical protein, partial [Microvirga aerilata]
KTSVSDMDWMHAGPIGSRQQTKADATPKVKLTTLLIVVSRGLGTPGHDLIETKRQSEFDQAARLTRWSDLSA